MSYRNERAQYTDRLDEIIAEVGALGEEAYDIMQQHFKSQCRRGEAYGAFTLGTSGNPYDTTLESLREDCLSELIAEDEAHPEFEH